MKIKKQNIILIGATGFTGQLIAGRLNNYSIPFCLCGRSYEKLSELKAKSNRNNSIQLLDVNNKSEVKKVLSQYDIIINCAGPYNLWGNQVLQYCSMSGKTYIDISGEQEFIKKSFENNEDAKKAGSTIIHSVSFESCLADLMASDILNGSQKYESISSYYFFKKSKPSGGTRLTMNISKHFPMHYVKNGNLTEAPSLSFSENVSFDFVPGIQKALFMPYPEVLFFQRKYLVSNSASYLLVNSSDAMLLQQSAKKAAPPIEAILQKHKFKNHSLSDSERATQEFTLAIKAVKDNGKRIIGHASGNDMYGITAFLVSRVVKNIFNGQILPRGVITPSEAGGWNGIWSDLKKENFITHIN